MFYNRIVKADGTVLDRTVITNCEYAEAVSDNDELTLGSVCSASLTFSLWSETASIAEGEDLTYYKVDSDTDETYRIGMFIATKPTKESGNVYSVKAYDHIAKTEKDAGDWLLALSWPITFLDFVKGICTQCGLTLANTTLPNADYQVPSFATSVTFRALLKWCGEVAGSYVHADAEGHVAFDWYKDKGYTVSSTRSIPWEGQDGKLITNESKVFYVTNTGGILYQDSLSYQDYQVASVDTVQIKQSQTDVGVVYPDTKGTNTYAIVGNYLLLTSTEDKIKAIAQHDYEVLTGAVYTPCTFSIIYSPQLRAGDIVSVYTLKGATFRAYITSISASGQTLQVKCTGSSSRTSNTYVNHESQSLSGKLLTIDRTIEGLRVSNEDLQGQVSTLTLNVNGMTSFVGSTASGNMLKYPTFADFTTNKWTYVTDTGVMHITGTASDVLLWDEHIFDSSKPYLQGRSVHIEFDYRVPNTITLAEDAYISWIFWCFYTDGTYTASNIRVIQPPATNYATTDFVHVTKEIAVQNKAIKDCYLEIRVWKAPGVVETCNWFIGQQGAADQFSQLKQTIDGLTLSVTNGNESSTIKLKSGSLELASQNIQFTGMVTIQDLENAGATVINGSNITTGTINADLIRAGTITSADSSTKLDLTNGVFSSAGTTRVSGSTITINMEISAAHLTTSIAEGAELADIGAYTDENGLGGGVHLKNESGATTISLAGTTGAITCAQLYPSQVLGRTCSWHTITIGSFSFIALCADS